MSKEPKIVWNLEDKIDKRKKRNGTYYKKNIGKLKRIFCKKGF